MPYSNIMGREYFEINVSNVQEFVHFPPKTDLSHKEQSANAVC